MTAAAAASLGRGRRRAVRILLALVCCGARLAVADPRPGEDHGPSGTPAAHCAALISQFDEIIISQFDYRILMLEDYELAEAREWRDRAEADCAVGRYDFGIGLIASALRQIGVVLGPDEDEPLAPY